MNDRDYSRGVAWGKKVFREHVKAFGETGIYMTDKAAMTCGKYADSRTRKTKTGKVLNDSMRSFIKVRGRVCRQLTAICKRGEL